MHLLGLRGQVGFFASQTLLITKGHIGLVTKHVSVHYNNNNNNNKTEAKKKLKYVRTQKSHPSTSLRLPSANTKKASINIFTIALGKIMYKIQDYCENLDVTVTIRPDSKNQFLDSLRQTNTQTKSDCAGENRA